MIVYDRLALVLISFKKWTELFFKQKFAFTTNCISASTWWFGSWPSSSSTLFAFAGYKKAALFCPCFCVLKMSIKIGLRVCSKQGCWRENEKNVGKILFLLCRRRRRRVIEFATVRSCNMSIFRAFKHKRRLCACSWRLSSSDGNQNENQNERRWP